jgi:hypothetical protein
VLVRPFGRPGPAREGLARWPVFRSAEAGGQNLGGPSGDEAGLVFEGVPIYGVVGGECYAALRIPMGRGFGSDTNLVMVTTAEQLFGRPICWLCPDIPPCRQLPCPDEWPVQLPIAS